MKKVLHYAQSQAASYAADKSSIRLRIEPAKRSIMKARKVDVKSESKAKKYTHDKYLYVRQEQRFDASLKYPQGEVGQLILNLYGSKAASLIFANGLKSHLLAHGFRKTEAYPCIYTRTQEHGKITEAVKTENVFVNALMQKQIDEFISVFKKYIL